MKGNKKTTLIISLAILLAALIIAVCIGMRAVPTVNHALRISQLLQPMLDAKNQMMHLSAFAEIQDSPVALESDLFLVSEDEVSYLVIEQNGTAAYISDNVLFLENGKAFQIGESMQLRAAPFADLLPQIAAMYNTLQITVEETDGQITYSITVTGEQAYRLLSAVSVGNAFPVQGIDTLTLTLTEKNEKLAHIQFLGHGKIGQTAAAWDICLSGFRLLAPGDYPIPEAVKESTATVNSQELFSLTEDLYRLVMAFLPLTEQATIDGALELTIDCGMLQLDKQMKLSDLITESASPIDPDDLKALPETISLLCMEGDIRCTQDGESYEYVLNLDHSAIRKLVQTLLPEIADYAENLTQGSVSVTLDNNRISSIAVSLKGKLTVLFTQIPISADARLILE